MIKCGIKTYNTLYKEKQRKTNKMPFIETPYTVETPCGFVRLMDILPKEYTSENLKCDEAIVQSARVSYNQSSKGDDQDIKLVKFLIDNNHGTPTESVIFKFHIKCPIFVQRHIVKHRISTMNEISARYVKVSDEWYTPPEFRGQSKSNRQASEGVINESDIVAEEFNDMCTKIYAFYEQLLAKGVAREIARTILPQAMYTQFYLTINLRSLMNLCNLRNSPDAQLETQQIAAAMENIMKITNPVSYSMFRKNESK